MSDIKCNASEFADVLGDVIQQYSDEVVKSLPDAVEKAADEGLKALKSNAAAQVGGTKYKSSFKKKTTNSSPTKPEITIHSSKYRIAHLLEHGHVIKNQTGRVYGVTAARPHWQPAEEEAIKTLEEEIQKKVEESG